MDLLKIIRSNPVLAIAELAGVLVLAFIEASSDNDFRIYLSASSDLFAGKDIFMEHYKDGFRYYYSPLFAAILFPFQFIPLYAAQFTWVLLNVFAFAGTCMILLRWLDFQAWNKKQKTLVLSLAFLFILRFLRDNFHYGQVTILMLYLPVQGLDLVFRGRKISGAALIALGINIKIFPIVLLPYVIYRKELKAAGAVVLFWGFFLLLPAVLVGFDQNFFLVKEWWHLINPSNQQHLIDTEETGFCGLSTLLPTLLMKNPMDKYALPHARNIADLHAGQVVFILNCVRAVFILFVFWFLRSKPFRSSAGLHRFWELSYLFLVIPLIFPHQQAYAYYLSFPAVLYLMYFQFENKKRGVWQVACAALLVLSGLLFNAYILAGEFKAYYDHYKIVAYGGLLLVGVLASCGPQKINTVKREN